MASRVRCVALERVGARTVPKLLARTTLTESTVIPWLCERARQGRALQTQRSLGARVSRADRHANGARVAVDDQGHFAQITAIYADNHAIFTGIGRSFAGRRGAIHGAGLGQAAASGRCQIPGTRVPSARLFADAGSGHLAASADNCAPTSVAQRSACSNVVFSSSARSCAS